MVHSTERETAILRVSEMEQAFDFLKNAWKDDPAQFFTNAAVRRTWDRVLQYYENLLWQADYRRDEQGMFPPELKRGILSEDGFYDFLSEVEAFQDTGKE